MQIEARRWAVALFVAALAVTPVFAERGGDIPRAPAMTPEEEAAKKYENGLKHRDKAVEHQQKASDATKDKDREKRLKDARKEFEKAAKDFRNAVEKNPRMFQAHSDLGYVLRQLGDYQASLAAYDTALEIQPYYGEAIEYRAEAYLQLGRTDDVKEAYLHLFREDRELAATLMTAMKKWVSEREGDAAAAGFAAWVAERDALAGQASSGGSGGRGW